MRTNVLVCDHCGASLRIQAGQKACRCEYCDSILQVPKELFDELNDAQSFLKEQEQNAWLAQRNAEGERAFQADKKIWNIALIAWVAVVFGLIAAEDFPSPFQAFISSYWPSLMIIGSAGIISAKPRRSAYLGFWDAERQQQAYRWITLWRNLLYAWTIVVSLCWGVPNEYDSHNVLFDIGLSLIIVGLVFFIRYRPSKRRTV